MRVKKICPFIVFLSLLVLVSVICQVVNAQDKTRLQWWVGAWRQEEAKRIVKGFEELYPDIDIEIQFIPWGNLHEKIVVACRSGNPPDLVNLAVAWNRPFAALGWLLPLDRYIKDSDVVDLSDFFEGGKEAGVYEGKIYGLPYRCESLALIYNKGMFREVGLDPNKAPETWTEFVTYCQKLTKPDVGQYGYGMVAKEYGNTTARLLPYVYANGGDILNKDYTEAAVNEPPFVEAVDFYASLFNRYKVAPPGSLGNSNNEVLELFLGGKVTIVDQGQYVISRVRERAPHIELGTGLTLKRKTRGSLLGGFNIAIPKDSKHHSEAWRFVEYLMEPEVMSQYTDTFPGRISAAERYPRFNDPLLVPFRKQLEFARNLPPIPQIEVIRKMIYEGLQFVMLQKKSAQKAMEDAASGINRLLK